MKTAAEIIRLYESRKAEAGVMLARMREVRDVYNGDIAIPLPEINKKERPAIANLLGIGIDQHGMRIASTRPNLYFPALEPGNPDSEKRAYERRQAAAGWLEASEYDLLTRLRARWLIAYVSTPVIVRPGPNRVPVWQVRNPLDCFPAATTNPTEMCPDDVVLGTTRSVGWLAPRYPEAAVVARAQQAQSWVNGKPTPDTKIEVVEYIDGDELVLIACGNHDPRTSSRGDYGRTTITELDGGGRRWCAELERIDNKTGMCLAVVPGRVTLDRPKGAVDDMVGLYQQEAWMMGLEVNAVAKSVYPDTWLVGRANEMPKIIVHADGPGGVVGQVAGGDIKEMNTQPGFQTYPTIDRLERAQRLAGGIPAEYSGESASNVRTGRRGQDIFSAVVDFPIQEAQELLAHSGEHELRRAVAVAKAYFGKEKRSFYVNWPKAKGHVDYTPDLTFEENAPLNVAYPSPGSDLNNLSIRVSNMLNNELMSLQTGRELTPEIDDPDLEARRVIVDRIDRAGLAAIEQGAAGGTIPPADIGKIKKLVLTGKSWEDAVEQVHEEMQQRQAPDVAPVAPGAPEAQPGLANPGMGAEAGVAQAPAPPSSDRLAQLLASLHKPSGVPA